MKNFSEQLQKIQNYHDFTKSPSSLPLPQQNISFQPPSILSNYFQFIAPGILSFFTSPITVASITMQLSPKALINPVQEKVKVAQSKGININPKYIANGIFGDNKIYRVQQLNGYRQCFQKLSEQGFLGFYKGNFVNLILSMTNSSLRNFSFNYLTKSNQYNDYLKNIIGIGICSLIDIFTNPLMVIQTRFILQNRNPNFRTYNSIYHLLRKVKPTQLLKGSLLHLPKNIAMTLSWLNLFKENPLHSFILSTLLAHVTTYPFTTLMRKLQGQSVHPMMLQDKFKGYKDIVVNIWNKEGVRGYYRGFLGYLVIHVFTSILMIQLNVRSGYYNQM